MISGGGVYAYRAMFYRLLDGDISRIGGAWFYVGLLIWLVLAVSGFVMQSKRGKEMYRRRGDKILVA